jgi:flagellar biosynthetic protein FliO
MKIMVKKRLFIVGSLLLLSIIGQVVLRPCLGEDKAMDSAGTTTPEQKNDGDTISNWNLSPDTAPKGIEFDKGFVGKFVSMLALVAVIGLAGWFFVKKMNGTWIAGKGRYLSILETMPLGPRRSVYLIQAGKKQLLIGSSPEGLRLLSDMGESIIIPTEDRK